jgi:predicted lipoprotein with Yx(FWY)xxD motif
VKVRLRSAWPVAFGVAALLLSACSNGSSASAYSGSTSSGSAVMIGTDNIPGIGTVLDNAHGLTLYYNTREIGGSIACTGSCTRIWPPVVVTGPLPKASASITGPFGSVRRPDGSTQLTYEGMPLYTYEGDSGLGQANGQGLQGIWFAATASGSSQSGMGGSSSGYGVGYGWGMG